MFPPFEFVFFYSRASLWYHSAMSKAVAFYDELKDRLDYALSSWLRIEPSIDEEMATRTILGASAFLFDNLFAKEDAGRKLTAEISFDQGRFFVAKALSEKATLLRINMQSDLFADGKSPLRDYLRWIVETEPEVASWSKDLYGQLAIVTIEELVNVFTSKPGKSEPLRVAELLFLNMTEVFCYAYRELLGPRFMGLKSSTYFLTVNEAMEGIRSEIRD